MLFLVGLAVVVWKIGKYLYAIYRRRQLTNMLQRYRDTYVEVPPASMSRAQDVVSHVKHDILSHFHSNFPELNITSLTDTGSSRECLKVVAPDEFDVTITISLDNMPWSFEQNLDTPGFYFVRKQTSDLCWILSILGCLMIMIYITGILWWILSILLGCLMIIMITGRGDIAVLFWTLMLLVSNFGPSKRETPYDKYIMDECLCPEMLMQDFQAVVQNALNNTARYELTVHRQGPAIKLHVQYGTDQTLDIDLVPTLEIEKTSLVAKPHRNLLGTQDSDPTHALLWRQSYSSEEHDLLASAPSNYRQVLKIIKAVRLNVPQFGKFSSYVYKMILMDMVKKDKMAHQSDSLRECFLKFLKDSELFFSKKKLPHVFNDQINVLEEYSPIPCDDLRLYISNLLKSGDFYKLLEERNYTGVG